MIALIKTPRADRVEGPTVLEWLRQQRQSLLSIERFWKVVLVSALAESLERASLAAARKVFVDGFLANRNASQILVPRVPLDELYDRRIAAWLQEQGIEIHRECTVEEVSEQDGIVTGLRLTNGKSLAFDFVILAVPWMRVGTL